MDHSQGFWLSYLHTHNSSLEGATELKFVSFCSPLDALSDEIMSCRNSNFQILAENHGLYSQAFCSNSLCTRTSSLEGALELKLCHSSPLEMPFLVVSLFAEFQWGLAVPTH